MLHHFFRIAKPESGLTWLHLLQAFPNIHLESVTLEIAEKSAGYRHGLGLSTVDSLILATFVQSGCELMVTSDSDFEMVARQQVIPVEILR